MKCPKCGEIESAVVDSRETEDRARVRRRRVCEKCGFRFTTYERTEQPRLMVIKKDGTRELFDRGKIAGGVYKAFHKRPLPAARVEELIDNIEREIFELNLDEVETTKVGGIVMNQIERIDLIAYIRFAAVYQEFKDLVTFDREIKKLIDKKSEETES
jgi:transcriptional repressor NrdR